MKVAIIGLGIMGAAYASNFLKSGIEVHGSDTDSVRLNNFSSLGGLPHSKIDTWVKECDFVLISLSSPVALHHVVSELANTASDEQIILETGTFSLDDKFRIKRDLKDTNAFIYDCTVSGTGAQAVTADLVFMISGANVKKEKVKECLSYIGRKVIDAGEYGNASKLKYVANHAVAVHNCAAAETLSYAKNIGLDEHVVYDMLSNGAGQSKMSDLRMPLMIDKNYTPATAHMAMFHKDLNIISEHLAASFSFSPLFDQCKHLYEQAKAHIPDDYDTAAIFEEYEIQLNESIQKL